jgi:hypothetical protein
MSARSGWLVVALAAVGASLVLPVVAQSEDAFQAGYRRGYQDGFRDGQRGGAGGNPTYVPPASQSNSFNHRGQGYGRVRGLQVLGALYGDGDRDCDATQAVASQFNGRSSAVLKVSNSLCGDPAPGERKSLRVEYLCGQERRSVSSYEHRSLEASCGQ